MLLLQSNLHLLLVVATWAFVDRTAAFVPSSFQYGGRQGVVTLSALTERQMQFWEDVEDGLKDIEDFYQKKEMGNIERIWGFCQR